MPRGIPGSGRGAAHKMIREFALSGARERLIEIESQRVAILAAFPELEIRRDTERATIPERVRKSARTDDSERPAKRATRKRARVRGGRPHPESTIAPLMDRMRDGASASALSREFGISQALISKWARKRGIKSAHAFGGARRKKR